MAFGGGGKEVEESLFLYNSIYVIYKTVVMYLPSAKITLADCYTVQILSNRGCSQSLADSANPVLWILNVYRQLFMFYLD